MGACQMASRGGVCYAYRVFRKAGSPTAALFRPRDRFTPRIMLAASAPIGSRSGSGRGWLANLSRFGAEAHR